MGSRGTLVALGVVALLGACSRPAPAPSARTLALATPAGAVTASLPAAAPPLTPSLATLEGSLRGDVLTETESCAGCHADAAAGWRSSAHASGSFNNPIYRVVVDAFRAEVGLDASRFCAGCHDVALLADGAMGRAIAPDDARAHGGITCRVCHGIESARPDGNGSYTLTASPIPIPRDGDDESLRAHKARMALPPLRTAALCGSCHRAFLSPETGNPSHLVGQDELGSWQRSAYAGSLATRIDEPLEPAECRSCHMPLEATRQGDAAARGGRLRSHRFAGAGTWLASMRGDAAQVEATQAMLRGSASIDVAVATQADGERTLPADGAPVRPGEPVWLDVVVRNERAGHRLPGGVLDAQDTWIELAVRDRSGRLLAAAGDLQESTGADPTAHVLRAALADDHGEPRLLRETQRFRASVYNHTIAPRDAAVVRFRFDVPVGLDAGALPLRVTARLRHRSRDLPLSRAVCAESKTPRGLAFAREVQRRTDARLDACAPEPVTDIATSEATLGGPVPAARTPAWRRLFDHGLGLLHAQQEELEGARPSLERALALADAEPGPRAMILHALAEVAIRQGRTEEAMDRLDDAEAVAPWEPAIPHARGEALAGVWRWKEAQVPFERAAAASPVDDALWSHLAVARGSAGDAAGALSAAAHGLALAPRDADLLRVQSLSLERLGAPGGEVARAREAFARFRPPDDAPRIRSACSATVPGCALERLPVHVHELRAAAPAARRQ